MIPKPEKDSNQKKKITGQYICSHLKTIFCHDSQHYPDWKHLLNTDVCSWLSDILATFCAFVNLTENEQGKVHCLIAMNVGIKVCSFLWWITLYEVKSIREHG